MLNFNTNQVVRDNEVMINGTIVGKLSDDEAQKVYDIIQGFLSTTPGTATIPAPTSTKSTTKTKTTPKRKAKSHKACKVDFEVKFTRKGNKVYLVDDVPRDVFAVLANNALLYGNIKWTKKTDAENGHFAFNPLSVDDSDKPITAVACAKQFMETNKVVKASERNNIRRNHWHWDI